MTFVSTETEARELARKLQDCTQIVLDVETHKTEQQYNKELIGVAIGLPRGLGIETYYVSSEQFRGNSLLRKALHSCEWIGHNLKFDLEICRGNGLDFQGPIYDTQILCHLVNENFQSYELDWLGQTQVGERKVNTKDWEKAFQGWNNIPFVAMGTYAMQDLVITWKLFLKFYPILLEQGLGDVWPEAMRYVRTLQGVIRTGIRVDRGLVSDLSREAGERLSVLGSQLAAIGISNPDSPKQVREYLYHTLRLKPINFTKPKPGSTSPPQPSTDNATLNTYVERYPQLQERLEALLEFRTLAKTKRTWYDGFLRRMGDRDYLHPGLKQHGTVTGRLSCFEPNLQQIPRNSQRVKRIFLDDGDWYLVEYDYSQIELRTGAWYAMKVGDPTMFKAYTAGEDVHSLTGNMIGTIQTLGPKEGRQVGKTGNFLWIYQGGPAKLQTTIWRDAKMRVSLDDAREWTQQFHSAYPGFMEINNRCRDSHIKYGYIRMFNGRRRRIKTKDDKGRIKHWTAFNAANQGGAGQVMMIAMNDLLQLQNEGAPFKIVNSVHDSVWALIRKDSVEEASDLIKKTMARPAEQQFELPFEIDMKFMPASKGAIHQ